MSFCFGSNCQVIFFPEKPSGIKIEQIVHFAWEASSGQVDGYRIYWGETEGGPYSSQLCDVNATMLHFITDLDGHQQYYLICRAYNEHGESGNSNEVHWP